MLGFFTDPYPDELLYSVVARYHQRAGYRSPDYTGWELFGSSKGGGSIALQSRLGHLISVLPEPHRYTADVLIDGHTLFPFYGAFLSADRGRQVREAMTACEGVANVYFQCGLVTTPHRLTHLRFCPACAAQDRAQFGETYWHRIHQVPGVLVCHLHDALLEETDIYVLDIRNRRGFTTAEGYIPVNAPPRALDPSDRRSHILRQLAGDVAWLLSQTGLSCELPLLQNRYRGLLHERGFMQLTMNGWVSRRSALRRAFIDFFSLRLLADLECSLRRDWLIRLYAEAFRPQPPLYHLLMMQFLGVSAADFFALPEREAPYGPGSRGTPPAKRGHTVSRATTERLAYNRQKVLTFIAENPGATRNLIVRSQARPVTYLRRYDREWLEAHLPERLSTKGIPHRSDWAERDAGHAAAVRAEAARMLNERGRGGKLVRITMHVLRNRLGLVGMSRSGVHLLPLTLQAMDEVVETRDEYNLRRLADAAEACRREGIQPVRRYMLLERAMMADNTARFSARVNEAIRRTLEELNS
jgi:hypothetical protein